MELRSIIDAWNSFFFTGDTGLTLAVFRIVFGLSLFCESVHLWGRASDYFGDEGVLSKRFYNLGYRYKKLSIFDWIGKSNRAVNLYFVFHSICCLSLAAGFMTNFCAALVVINFMSRKNRFRLAMSSGDSVAHFMAFLLMFSNAGQVASIDHMLFGDSAWLGPQGEGDWAMQLMKIQLSIIYVRSVLAKLTNEPWFNGTVVFHALYHNPGRRFAVPFPSFTACRAVIVAMTWGSLAIQLAGGLLLWIPEFRYPVLISLAAFHATLHVFMDIKQFQALMISSMILFIPSSDMQVILSHLGV